MTKNKNNKTTIQVSKETHTKLMLFKIKSKAKDLDEVIKKAIYLLKNKKEVKN